ncbi:MAG TPA: tetratricopeptide repeat protein [Thermoanaerobaculia bacterium]|nr:tetratricopeptide repeat protein [Thermoanaerobaculia bacterium]
MKHSDDLRHLAECASCRQRFSRNVVPFDAARRREDALKFAAAAARLENERGETADIAARQLRETPQADWPRLAQSNALRNNAALEQISEEVRKRLERDPAQALAVADLAAAIVETIPTSSYPPLVIAQIRSTALRDRANALRYLGRLDEAYDAIETAESRLNQFPAAVHDRAIIWMVKAMILAQMDHFEEAEQAISNASVIFADVNDSTRFLQAGVVYGNLLGRQERYTEAENIFRDLLPVAVSSHDAETEARLHNNLGFCYVNLGDYTKATIHFSQSIAKFTDLGLVTEVARTERGAGTVLIGKGQFDLGCSRLREARAAFTKLQMPQEAGLCALRLIEAMVERGETDEARDLAATVINEFTAAMLDMRAIDAVVRLRQSLDADGATAEAVRTVHALVESLAVNEARAS